jgi:ParB family chromosome partitioning protein
MKETTKKDNIGTITELPLELLVAFPEHPFKPYSGEQLWDLVKSIEEHGVLSPILVRPAPDGQRYEIISGHNRVNASRRAGLKTIPATVREMDDDEATLAMVESNLRQREQLLPSEKAKAYKMRVDALRKKAGRPSNNLSQVGTNKRTDQVVAEEVGESRNQVQRYIRLTNLITPILDMVDEKRMAMGPAVELSYLPQDDQELLLDVMTAADCTPSLSQAIRLRKLSEAGQFDPDRLDEIIDEEKPNQREKVTFRLEDLVPYFPESSVEEIRDIIMKLIEREVKRRRKERSDDRDR